MSTRQRIESEIEDTGPYATVVDVLVAEASKPVTKRIVEKVASALARHHGARDYEVRIDRHAGMTNVEWGGYTRTQGRQGRSILIAYSEKSEPIAERHVADMKRYLAAAHERNEQRRRILATDAPERIDMARARIEVAMQEIDAIYHQDGNYAVLLNADRVVEEIQKGT